MYVVHGGAGKDKGLSVESKSLIRTVRTIRTVRRVEVTW
jgi:hypothetical protein